MRSALPNLTEADIREVMAENRDRLIAIAEAVMTVLAASKPTPVPATPDRKAA